MTKTEELKQEVQRILLQYMSAIHAELIHSHDDVFLANQILQAFEQAGGVFLVKDGTLPLGCRKVEEINVTLPTNVT